MQPRNPWQMLAEPLGSTEPRLKITGLVIAVASIPVPGGRSLQPVKNGGSFSPVGQSTPLTIPALFFTGQLTPLTKLPPRERKKAQIGGGT